MDLFKPFRLITKTFPCKSVSQNCWVPSQQFPPYNKSYGICIDIKRCLLHQIITRPNCALDRLTILCLYVPGFHRQVFEHVKKFSGQLKEMKEKKNKGSVLVAESVYNSQNTQLGSVMTSLHQMSALWPKA